LYCNNYNNIIVSKLIYYDEKNILPDAHQVKIIGYSLSKLEINAPIHEKQKNLFIKLQRIKDNMCKFINLNNVYGFKIIAHIITKSLVIPSGSMA
jgi:hypothetical protein